LFPRAQVEAEPSRAELSERAVERDTARFSLAARFAVLVKMSDAVFEIGRYPAICKQPDTGAGDNLTRARGVSSARLIFRVRCSELSRVTRYCVLFLINLREREITISPSVFTIPRSSYARNT